MKLSNFKLIDVRRGKDWPHWDEYFATVDVENRAFFFFKKTRKRVICRKASQINWFFVDTGETTPGWQAENSARAWVANGGALC